MRLSLFLCLFLFAFVLVGCEQKAAPVAETEDQFAAYDKMIAEQEAQAAAEEEEAGE